MHQARFSYMVCDPTGRLHNAVITTASVHYSQVMEDCLHGEEKVIYGDKANADQTRKEKTEYGKFTLLCGILLYCTIHTRPMTFSGLLA